MKVDDAMANAFVKEGTSTVFGLLGDGQLKWWAAMAKKVRIVDVRDEGCAVAMADGWARASGKVGVCSVTQGPGITRIATSLVTASRYRTPIVIHAAATGLTVGLPVQVEIEHSAVELAAFKCGFGLGEAAHRADDARSGTGEAAAQVVRDIIFVLDYQHPHAGEPRGR